MEISEVTVTVETIKYNQPSSSEEHIFEKTVAEDEVEDCKDPLALGHSRFATQEAETGKFYLGKRKGFLFLDSCSCFIEHSLLCAS